MSESIVLNEVTKSYKKGGQTLDALKSVSMKIAKGEAVAIMGPSGSGKSTMLQLIGGVDSSTSGEVTIEGHAPKSMSDASRSKFRLKMIGFVFQQFFLQPFLSAQDNVALPMRLNGTKAKIAREKAVELLKKVGLGEKTQHRPSELSGGEMQRVAIARALANSPQVLLADEPTGNLDRGNADAVIDIFKSLSKEGTTVVVVTHDEKVASQFGRVIRLENGVIESDKKKTTTKKNVEKRSKKQ